MEDQQEFLDTMEDRSLKEEFYAAIVKDPADITSLDIKALIKRSPQLSDDERFKFRYILIYENLTEDEIKMFNRLYPPQSGGARIDKYFHKRENVDEHYKTNFVQGRTIVNISDIPEEGAE